MLVQRRVYAPRSNTVDLALTPPAPAGFRWQEKHAAPRRGCPLAHDGVLRPTSSVWATDALRYGECLGKGRKMVNDCVIGIDCSTTATKAVVWDEQGNAVSEGRETFDLSSPRPDWGEQNAEDWWRSTRTAIRHAAQAVDAPRIKAIGITHQRETFVCLDEEDQQIRPA